MSKSIVFAGVLIATILPSAFAQTVVVSVHRHHPVTPYATGTIAANGRCGGISYGTGARRCGTATGGPSGGLSSRN